MKYEILLTESSTVYTKLNATFLFLSKKKKKEAPQSTFMETVTYYINEEKKNEMKSTRMTIVK